MSTNHQVVPALPWNPRILIAIDGSAPSMWTVQVGGRLAQALSAPVMLVHVIEAVTRVPTDLVFGTPELQEEHRELCRHGRELLEKTQAALPPALQSDTLLREGSPVAEILLVAHTWKADLILMGTRGRGRLTQFLLGSVAEAVLREAPCPVLTAGPASEGFVSQSRRGSGETPVAQL